MHIYICIYTIYICYIQGACARTLSMARCMSSDVCVYILYIYIYTGRVRAYAEHGKVHEFWETYEDYFRPVTEEAVSP